MEVLLPLGLLFAWLTAMIAVLIVGAQRKWSFARIGGFVFLVISVSNLVLIALGRAMTLAIIGALWSGSAAVVLLLRDRFVRTVGQQPAGTPDRSGLVANAAFDDVDDDELVAYAERLSQVVAKRLRVFPVLMLSVVALSFFGDRLPVPELVPLILIMLLATPLIVRLWGSDLHRYEAVLELARRGLPRPQGTDRITPAWLRMYKRARLPMALIAVDSFLLFGLIQAQMSGLLPESVLVNTAIFGLIGLTFVWIFWIMALLVRSLRTMRS